MQVFCTRCGRELEVPNTALHKRVKCTLCGEIFTAELPKAEVVDDDAGDVEILGPVAPPPLPPVPPPQRPVVYVPPPTMRQHPTGPSLLEEEEILEPDLADEKPPPSRPSPWTIGPRLGKADALAHLAQSSKSQPQPQPQPRPKKPPGWFFHDASGAKLGPFPGQGIVQAIKEGKVTRDTILINSRSDKQLRAGDVPGLFKPLPKPSPLSPLARGKFAVPPPEAQEVPPPAEQPADNALDALARAAKGQNK